MRILAMLAFSILATLVATGADTTGVVVRAGAAASITRGLDQGILTYGLGIDRGNAFARYSLDLDVKRFGNPNVNVTLTTVSLGATFFARSNRDVAPYLDLHLGTATATARFSTATFSRTGLGGGAHVGVTNDRSGLGAQVGYTFGPGVLDIETGGMDGSIVYRFPLRRPVTLVETTSKPTPTPTPVIEVTSTPSPTPSPTPTPCGYRLVDGWFEAIQGPYQDDPVFRTKPYLLSRSNAEGDNPEYYQPLYLVANRPTVLAGVDHYRAPSGTVVTPASRDTIVFRGVTNCTKNDDVRARFTLRVPGSAKTVYLSAYLGRVRMSGKARPVSTPFEIDVPAPKGLPDDGATIPTSATDYAIVGELETKSGPTGMRITVSGIGTTTQGPILRIVPVIFTTTGYNLAERGATLTAAAKALAARLHEYVPDIFPLKPGGLPMPEVDKLLDVTRKVGPEDRDALLAALADRLAVGSYLENVGRTIALMGSGDYALFKNDEGYSVAFTMSRKVVLVRSNDTWDDAAHEIAHTMPDYLWSKDQMLADCGYNYHNEPGKWAFGIQLTSGGYPLFAHRVQVGVTPGLMQPSAGLPVWIEACTYKNLLDALQSAQDPPVTLLRGIVTRTAGRTVATFSPGYDLDGNVDLKPDGRGDYAFVTRDAGGTTLATYRFDPVFETDGGRALRTIAFAYRVPRLDGVARVDLVGPAGTLASFARSTSAPTLSIDAPSSVASGRRSVRISWSTHSANGTALSSVLASKNARPSYTMLAFESRLTHFDVPIAPGARSVRVKVVTTDGSRSTERIVVVAIRR